MSSAMFFDEIPQDNLLVWPAIGCLLPVQSDQNKIWQTKMCPVYQVMQ